MKSSTAGTLLLLLSSMRALAGPCDAYFPFDGSLADASGNNYHGLPITKDGQPGTVQFGDGKIGQAVHITGENAVRAFVDLHYDFCPQVTVTAWFRLASSAADGNQYIFSTGAGSGPAIRANKSTLIMSATGNGISQRDAVRDPNTWFFLAGVYDYTAGTYKLYWRSRVVEGKIADSRRDPEDSFWVGTYNDALSYTAQDLYVDDLRIHGRALSADELRAVAADTSGAPADTSTLTAEQLTALGANYSGVSFGSALGAGTLPACSSHEDCTAGSYCAWDNTCHPERHAPKQALTFTTVAAEPMTTLLPEDARFENQTDTTTTTSGPYGAGDPRFTSVAGNVGGSQRLLDLGEEFLTSIRLKKVNGTCQIWANDKTLDLCGSYADTYTGDIEELDVALQTSVIGRLSVCSIGTVVGLQIWGDVVNADGSTTYQPAADKDDFPVCRTSAETFGSRWTSSMLCASGYLGTGLVVHSNDVGPQEVITGLQLICRRVAVR